MTELNKKAWRGLIGLFLAMTILIFLPAWSLTYWQGWLFLAAFFIPDVAITLYLMKHDPKLLERRVSAGPTAEKQKSQKLIQTLASVAFLAIFLTSILDYRFGWSYVPAYVVIIGDALVVLGLYFVFLVFKENSFTSATIETSADQKLISTGPYAIVRHPMYAGAFVMLLGVPLALGSLWGFIPVLALVAVIVWRLLDEERFLDKNLPGYPEYRQKIRYRLIPWVW